MSWQRDIVEAITETARADLDVQVDTYSTRVQDALDLVERETAIQERRERQATCPHDNIMRVEDSTYGDPAPRYATWCADCWMPVEEPS